MDLEIVEETPETLAQYEKVPIWFRVESRLRVELLENGLGGLRLIEGAVVPYLKDYDREMENRPSQWPRHGDLATWGIFSAWKQGQRVGGAAVAWKTPGLGWWEDDPSVACLWDLRVHTEHRGRGIGHQLFGCAAGWARRRGCQRLVVETQNTNVAACRFYARHGCELVSLNRHAYREIPEETQLIWCLEL